MVHKENFLEQQPLSHMSFCKPIDTQILFLLASYLHVGKQSGVLTNFKKRKKGTGITDTALLSTVAILGTTTKHRLWSQPVMEH